MVSASDDRTIKVGSRLSTIGVQRVEKKSRAIASASSLHVN